MQVMQGAPGSAAVLLLPPRRAPGGGISGPLRGRERLWGPAAAATRDIHGVRGARASRVPLRIGEEGRNCGAHPPATGGASGPRQGHGRAEGEDTSPNFSVRCCSCLRQTFVACDCPWNVPLNSFFSVPACVCVLCTSREGIWLLLFWVLGRVSDCGLGLGITSALAPQSPPP